MTENGSHAFVKKEKLLNRSGKMMSRKFRKSMNVCFWRLKSELIRQKKNLESELKELKIGLRRKKRSG